MDITISIVSYNTKELLRKCVKSIYKNTKDVKFEIIVVDNNSTDGSKEMIKKEFPGVRLIENNSNKYFAKANNQALKIARGRYFLILNSDTFFFDNSVSKFIDFMDEHKDVGAVDGLEILEDGKIMKSGSLFSTPLIDFYELSYFGTKIANQNKLNKYRLVNKDRKKEFKIDVGCDAFLCVRTELLEKIGGYDENFYLYYTENDLCLRIKNEGYEIIHYPKVQINHAVSSSVKKIGWKKYDLYYKDLLTYYNKNGYKLSGGALFLLLHFEKHAFILKDEIRNGLNK